MEPTKRDAPAEGWHRMHRNHLFQPVEDTSHHLLLSHDAEIVVEQRDLTWRIRRPSDDRAPMLARSQGWLNDPRRTLGHAKEEAIACATGLGLALPSMARARGVGKSS